MNQEIWCEEKKELYKRYTKFKKEDDEYFRSMNLDHTEISQDKIDFFFDKYIRAVELDIAKGITTWEYELEAFSKWKEN